MPRTRGNGEGSVRDRPNGGCEARATIDGEARSKSFRTKVEARAWLLEVRTAQAAGIPVPKDNLTVAAFLGDWLTVKEPRLKRSTHTRYSEFVRRHVAPALGSLPLTKLSPTDLERFYASMAAPTYQPRRLATGKTTFHPLSTGTIKLIAVMLHGALKYAVERGLAARNVAAIAKALPVERSKRLWLNGDEADALLTAAAGHRLEALFVLAITTGMRAGELLALRWDDVHLDGKGKGGRPWLHVGLSVRQNKGGFTTDRPKTKASSRDVLLTNAAAEVLRQRLTAQKAERLAAGAAWAPPVFTGTGTPPAWSGYEPVFATPTGGYLGYMHLRKTVHDQLVKAAGLRPIPLHSLRHTAITLMLEDGLDVRTIADIVGHADGGALILKVYGHATDTMLDRAVAGMDARFGRAAV